MKKKVIIIILVVVALLLGVMVVTHMGNDDTPIVSGIIANKSFNNYKDLEAAKQSQELSNKNDIFATVHYIESPKGEKYVAKWTLNGKDIKKETLEVTGDTQGVLTTKISSSDLAEGKLQFCILSNAKNKILYSNQITLK